MLYMRTSHPDVFAAGDCCAVYNNASRQYFYILLATNAVRMGTLAARNLKAPTTRHRGTQGTSGIKIYDWNIASTSALTRSTKGVIGSRSSATRERMRESQMNRFLQ